MHLVYKMTNIISVRLGKDLEKYLKLVEKSWQVDRSEIVRRLLDKALSEWRIENALEQLKKHKISLGKAAEDAGVSLGEMIDLAGQKNIDWIGYNEEDLKKDLKILNDI
jgi:predicted HTH domain antitoxin